jgi:flagellar basal body P-ring formation protein FlgA
VPSILLAVVLGFAAIAISGIAVAAETSAGQVRIALRAEAAVSGPEVRLGDLAVLHTQDLPTIQRLVALPMGNAPRVGADVLVTRSAIASWLRNQLGTASTQLLWSGPDKTRVRRVHQQISGIRLQGAAEDVLREWLAQRVTRYSVQPLAAPNELQVPSGEVQLTPRALPEGARLSPRMVVWLDVHVGGEFVRVVPVTFTVDAYRDAWISRPGVPQGVSLSAGMLEQREVKVGWPSMHTASAGEVPRAWRTTRAIPAGEPITVRNVAAAPLVGRGDWVVLRLKSGLVEVESRAQALQDGQLGQLVQVRSNERATLPARVTAAGHVEAAL